MVTKPPAQVAEVDAQALQMDGVDLEILQSSVPSQL
jgi:hypothetical protein